MELQTKARTVVVLLGAVVASVATYFVIHPPDDKRHTPFADPGQDPVEPRELLSALRIDAAALPEGRPDPAPPAGDLMAEARAFSTLDACVAERARLDPLVGDSLRAIGYDTFLRDSCRILEALQQQSQKPCIEIASTPLKNHCSSTVAIALAHPDECPFASDQSKAEGRDPFCIAVASRDPRLCVSVRGSRVTCEAVLARAVEKCPRTGDGGDCRHDVARLRTLVTGDVSKEKPLRATKITLSVRGEGDTESPMPGTAELGADAAKGVVLVRARDRYVVEVGSFGGSAFAPASLRLSSALRVSEKTAGGTSLERFELDLPARATVVFPGNRVDGKITFDPWKAARGEPVGITFEGRVTVGANEYTVNERVETFIRDVVTEDVPAPPPPLGATVTERDR